MQPTGHGPIVRPPAADLATIRWLAAGNPEVGRVLAEVVARQPGSIAWQLRAEAAAAGLPSQLAYEAPALPLCVREARGSRIVDVDGVAYLDCHLAYTAGILGHRPDAVAAALHRAVEDGVGAGAFVPAQVELAELVCQLTGHEQVAILHTGGQAVEAAVRISRAVSGRRLVAKFEGCYHGAHDVGLHNATAVLSGPPAPGPPDAICPTPATGGVLPSSDLLILPFNDDVALDLLRRHAPRLAAVVVDPCPAFMGGRLDEAGAFVRALREVTLRHRILLVLDEVVTGFRLARGGAAEAFGIRGDLSCYAKIVGGMGLPVALVAGAADLLAAASTAGVFRDRRAGKAWITSTNAANALSVVAALAQLRHLGTRYEQLMGVLDDRGARLREGVARIARETGIDVAVRGHPRLQSGMSFTTSREPTTYRDALAEVTLPLLRAVMTMTYYLRLEGIHVKVVPTTHLSTAHSADDVDELLAAVGRCLRRMRDHGLLPVPDDAPPISTGGAIKA